MSGPGPGPRGRPAAWRRAGSGRAPRRSRAASTRRRSARGVALVELLVGLACTAVLAAAVLPLLVGGAQTVRGRLDRLGAQSRVDAAVETLYADLRAVAAGLEGATAVRHRGNAIAILEAPPDGDLRLLRTLAAESRVVEGESRGPYRVSGGAGLAPGTAVVALGAVEMPAAAAPPLGTVVAVQPAGRAASTYLAVAWAPQEAALLAAWGRPAAFVPVRFREYATREAGGFVQLRRRDEGGNWQPVADNLGALTLSWGLDADRDGRLDGDHRTSLAPADLESLVAVEIAARVAAGSAGSAFTVTAVRSLPLTPGVRRLR